METAGWLPLLGLAGLLVAAALLGRSARAAAESRAASMTTEQAAHAGEEALSE